MGEAVIYPHYVWMVTRTMQALDFSLRKLNGRVNDLLCAHVSLAGAVIAFVYDTKSPSSQWFAAVDGVGFDSEYIWLAGRSGYFFHIFSVHASVGSAGIPLMLVYRSDVRLLLSSGTRMEAHG